MEKLPSLMYVRIIWNYTMSPNPEALYSHKSYYNGYVT